jgi:general stress protein 26
LTDRGHDLWAPVTGRLSWQSDRAVIDRPWPPLVAAWHDGGKEDPRLVLLPFDPAEADIWTEGSNLLAGLTLLLRADPKALRAESVARVALL